jgi:two-component system, chemotaxis family, chemotaxis protein CheY
MQNGATLDRLKLPIALDLAAADGLLETMRNLPIDSHPRIDASQVETLTLPCAQVLLAAQRSGAHLTIESPSAAFVSAIEDLGLDCAELCNGVSAIELDAPNVDLDLAVDPEPAQVQAEDSPVSKRILTIDDSKTIRDMLMLTLADAGFEVLQAVDGQDGLDVLEKERVDVVITDINMPRMDGYEVIRRMRSNPIYKSMPVLVLTTENDADKKGLARAAGATGWMVKPFDPDRLIATINKVAP